MQEVAEIFSSQELDTQERLDRVERALLAMPQAECSLAHHFGPGVYVRELSMKAGTWAIGHHQKHPHLNVLIKGAVQMPQDDGTMRVVRAPLVYVGEPGRKAGYVLEDTVWLNVYATEERDIEKLEAHFVEKSRQWVEAVSTQAEQMRSDRQVDRDDFASLPDVQNIGRHEVDPVQLGALGGANVRIRPSAIEGLGLFLNSSVEPFHVIAPAVTSERRTPAGRYANHSAAPNACLVRRLDGGIDLVSLSRIRGCVGGQEGDEVTIDYRQAQALMAAWGTQGEAS